MKFLRREIKKAFVSEGYVRGGFGVEEEIFFGEGAGADYYYEMKRVVIEDLDDYSGEFFLLLRFRHSILSGRYYTKLAEASQAENQIFL